MNVRFGTFLGVLRRLVLGGFLVLAILVVQENFRPGPLQGQELITVQGQLVNGTQGASVSPGTVVMLHAFATGAERMATTETTTDKSGGFRFEDVTPNGDIGYAISTEYAGMPYTILIGPEDVENLIELLVYETTQDLSVIVVEHHALIISDVSQEDQQIAAVEFISLTNTSDRTLLPDLSNVGQGQFSFMRFSLPAGATEFDIQSDLVGGEVIPVGTGFGLTTPVVPGAHSLNFSFKFHYTGDFFSYQQNLLQGANTYQVLIPRRFSQIQVGNLESRPDLKVEDSVYRVWEGQDFAPGQGITVKLTNLPQPSLLARLGRRVAGREFWLLAIPISLGAVLALVLLYTGFRSPRTATASSAEGLSRSGSDAPGRRALVREIAVLDQRFQSGQVPEGEYQSQRASLKNRILEADQPADGGPER